jgi:hypothetical protein
MHTRKSRAKHAHTRTLICSREIFVGEDTYGDMGRGPCTFLD